MRHEPPAGGAIRDPAAGELFPHLYGELELAVVAVLDWNDGSFALPAELAR